MNYNILDNKKKRKKIASFTSPLKKMIAKNKVIKITIKFLEAETQAPQN